jgi:hypothetical protein
VSAPTSTPLSRANFRTSGEITPGFVGAGAVVVGAGVEGAAARARPRLRRGVSDVP